jgi:hypothetical protein
MRQVFGSWPESTPKVPSMAKMMLPVHERVQT